MKPVIDVHSHVLPYVDDGSRSLSETKAMLRMYEDQGVEAIICTPHFGPCGFTGINVNMVLDIVKKTKPNVKLYLGREIFYSDDFLKDVYTDYAHTMAGSRFILVEFENWWYSTPAEEILTGLIRLKRLGFTPILAHAERYPALRRNPDFFRRITKNGVKLQINAYDICENKEKTILQTTRYLLKNQLVSFIGSDAHGSLRRPPALRTGVQWIYEHCPQDYADAVVHDNAATIIKEGGA